MSPAKKVELQQERDETLILFSNQTYPILIASDVASRGLDIDDVELVINYDLALNSKIHTHRIGRTARAGKGGVSISFYTNDEENRAYEFKELFSDIEFKSIETVGCRLKIFLIVLVNTGSFSKRIFPSQILSRAATSTFITKLYSRDLSTSSICLISV